MKTAQEKLRIAQEYAISNRPHIGGFPFFAECLRLAGVQKNIWSLPSAQSIYVMDEGAVVFQGTPLVTGSADVLPFDKDALVTALRHDQAGNSTFPEFLTASWNAGIIQYIVDFFTRTVTYYGARGETYQEPYPAVEVSGLTFA